MKKALEELVKELVEQLHLVEELVEQLLVGYVHDVNEPQALKQKEKECQQGALPSLWL